MEANKYNYLTTYNKEYVEKPRSRIPNLFTPQQFEDPISEGYKLYLTLEKNENVPPNEYAEEYLEKLKKKYQDTARIYFQEPIDNETIMRNKITKGIVSEYQTNYCDIEKDIDYYLEKRRHKHNLPDDFKIPLTSYSSHYRNPTIYHGDTIEKMTPILPTHNLKIKGGKHCSDTMSEYTQHVGNLGGLIIKNMYKKHQLCTKK